ncbi:FadR family transcriptional regulator [Agrobacterium sp. SHOUNA12C]|uniref:GntR family transcriptional regulator n=1 Tax=Rhizobium rhizogenes NBRC 13257 TaxID=1220581 RepID=A0AA87Q441_RHIRH|nr:FadR/GntR family transcriptional regulator [Rhizobium rhizogenes]MCJ9720679.1 FadR family transcriptional regulator [Agrobacterium sp. BETTINA12B]MCJ9757259.1 FadR family transcriptional regulator [Agrobacterium sp. SHOUNA12C]NTF51327.1 FadR family transcriptional regulator [Rhizobium rhizogenes]NTF57862.1 FadR family transcriptional regulator [Rhizobium rhizogenes]NTF64280.1 FadR family transcriptional regulator [Rhizobium rhizogenes]
MDGSPILSEVPNIARSLARRTARDVIAEKLMVLIATNMLRPGDELPGERELANVLHVSRETVRGAIQTLAGQGIIEISHGSRSRVCKVDLSHITVTIASPNAIDSYDLESVHAARLHIELKVVGDAAERIDEATLAKLQALLEAQRLGGDDAMRFLICDREFHVAIYRACGNPLLAAFVTDLYTYMMHYRRNAMSKPGAIEASYSDHLSIFEALTRHDREAVVAAFEHHLTRIYETTRILLATDKAVRASEHEEI